MIIAIDVFYNDDASAYAVAVGFNWKDAAITDVFTAVVSETEPYEPGQFYKRELPCIKEVLKDIKTKNIDVIVVDGHVYVDDDKTYGLGAHVWELYHKQNPIIGVAKSSFAKNMKTVVPVFRGTSKNPLYISAIGLEKEIAANYIQNMHGQYRIPAILKEVDSLSRIQEK